MSSAFWLSGDDIDALLGELDERLRARGSSAALFLVGGAALIGRGLRPGGVTEDIDGLTRTSEAYEIAQEIAHDHGLSPRWLNGSARMWMPPLPQGVEDPPREPGLTVHEPSDEFLFATKLVAQRAKDADDVLALARACDMVHADAQTLEEVIRRYYTDEESLAFILDGADPAEELRLIAEDAARFIASRTSGGA
ncbi:hypothetical protein [Zhihengliuella salsuginis]|uniref:Nucleotidyl transferase AbiEii toxin, Type IV TA system n=1 Tax=Zhihengliuella salsuginis TaxID=578222 RepID=A0ABQ3GJN6_9MICC|nr:hypothetical protein [Zhihengliuella salsuginis]GHD10882.1 hypothetical protein GCM10008096_24880 [Zhihengliuella salsuginis]